MDGKFMLCSSKTQNKNKLVQISENLPNTKHILIALLKPRWA